MRHSGFARWPGKFVTWRGKPRRSTFLRGDEEFRPPGWAQVSACGRRRCGRLSNSLMDGSRTVLWTKDFWRFPLTWCTLWMEWTSRVVSLVLLCYLPLEAEFVIPSCGEREPGADGREVTIARAGTSSTDEDKLRGCV